jgi:transcriptional regulator with XRE-family HTH domain
MTTVGRRLKKWRDSHDLTQRAAAKRAGVSQAAWQAVESGRCKRLGIDVAARIVRSTDGAISLDDFVAKQSRAA